jgi:outer membrane protein TolC
MQSPVNNFPNIFRDQMEIDYYIQQMIPFPGKLSAMARVEEKRKAMLASDLNAAEQEIVRTIKGYFFELYLLDRKIEINRESRDIIGGFVEIARTRYEFGTGKQSDLLRAETELSSLRNDRIVFEQQRKSIAGMLNSLCNRPLVSAMDFIPAVEPDAANYDPAALLSIAEKRRPELQSIGSTVGMQQAEMAAAKKEFYPDFMLRGIYKQMMKGPDNWGLMAGISLPFAPWSYKKYSAAVRRSEAGVRAAQADFDNMKNMITAEVNDALLKVASSTERLKLSRETALPQAKRALESAVAAYKTGKEEFIMLIDLERMLVMAKLDYQMATMNLLDSQAQLERAVGATLAEIDKTSKGEQ